MAKSQLAGSPEPAPGAAPESSPGSTKVPLTGQQIRRLQAALLDAFDLDSLRRMVRTDLDQELAVIVAIQGRTLTDIVYDLIRHYAAGDIHRLLAAACAANPSNRRLVELNAEFAAVEFAPLPLLEGESHPHAVFDQHAQHVTSQINVAGDYVTVAQPSRSPPQRTVLAGIAAVAGLALTAGMLWLLWPRLAQQWAGPICAGSQFCTVVARLAAPDPAQSDELTAEIAQHIRDVLGNDDAGQARVAIVPSVDDEVAARQVAADAGALLAVWGRVLQQAGGKLRVQFELANLLGVGETHNQRTLRAEPLLYDPIAGRVICANCFDIAEGELGQRIAIVAHAAAGLMHYAGRPEQAYHDFMAALYCAGEEIEPELRAALRPTCAQRIPLANWNPALLHYYAGKSAVLSGNYAKGIDLLQTAATENPYDPAAPLGVAAAYQAWSGNAGAPDAVSSFAEAVRRIQDLLLTVPDDDSQAVLYHDLGLVYELQSNWEMARTNYAKAVDLFGTDQPSAYTSLVRLGNVLAQTRDFATADARLQQAVALDRDAPWAYLELANLAWQSRQDRAAAEQWLRQADQVAPGAADVSVTHAELCESWGDWACAEQAFTAALAHRPRSGWLHGRIGTFYLPTNPGRAGQSWEKAADQYGWSVDLRPQDPWAHERLAYVLLNQRQAGLAADHYARAIALTKSDSTPARLYCGLALAQLRDGKEDAAKTSQAECDRRSAGHSKKGA